MKKIFIGLIVILILLIAGCAPGEKNVPPDSNDDPKEIEDETLDITLYFGDDEAISTGEPGKYGYVTPVSREISHTEEVLRAALEELIEGPAEEDGEVHPVVHDSLNILNIDVENNTAVINVCREMFGEDWVGGTLGGTIFVQSFTRTAAQFPEVDKVQVLVEGEYWNDGHMIWDEPIAPQNAAPEEEVYTEDEIEVWKDNSRELMLAQDVVIDDTLYLLVTYGVRPTGGYSVKITDVAEKEEELVVTAEFTEPGEDEPVTQALTRPYDLKEMEPTDLPIKFVAEGDEAYVPTLMGINVLRPIVAQSDGIKVFTPAPDSTVYDKLKLQGIANVFEGTVLYRLLGSDEKEMESGITTGAMGDWGYFEEQIPLPADLQSGEELLLELYTESAKDGSVENLIEIELQVE